jgi:hypothetical protein
MQFLMLIKHAENQGTPPESLFDAMDKYVSKSFAAGALINTGGLTPSAQGKEVRIRNGRMSVVDGPFTEAKEIVGGYAIVKADSWDHALEISREFMQMHLDHWPEWEGTSEVREIAAMPEA